MLNKATAKRSKKCHFLCIVKLHRSRSIGNWYFIYLINSRIHIHATLDERKEKKLKKLNKSENTETKQKISILKLHVLNLFIFKKKKQLKKKLTKQNEKEKRKHFESMSSNDDDHLLFATMQNAMNHKKCKSLLLQANQSQPYSYTNRITHREHIHAHTFIIHTGKNRYSTIRPFTVSC